MVLFVPWPKFYSVEANLSVSLRRSLPAAGAEAPPRPRRGPSPLFSSARRGACIDNVQLDS